MRLLGSLALAAVMPATVWAQATLPDTSQPQQTLKFDAQVMPNGDVQLVPTHEFPNDAMSPHETVTPDSDNAAHSRTVLDLFLVKNADGVVKGIFDNQNAAFAHPLEPGDKIEVFAASANLATGAGTPNNNDDYMTKVAQKAAKQLLTAAKDSACGFDPLPETITPTVEVSFSLFAGGSLSISATWNTSTICKK